jgi:hypothetical protein
VPVRGDVSLSFGRFSRGRGHGFICSVKLNKLVLMSQSDHHVVSKSFESFGSSFKWVFIVYLDVEVRSQEVSEIDRSLEEASKHLTWRKDDRSLAKQLRKSLELLVHTHTEERDKQSEFHRRTSLELILWFWLAYIHKGHEAEGRQTSQR